MEHLFTSPPIGLDLLLFLCPVKKKLGSRKCPLHPQGELVDVFNDCLFLTLETIDWNTRMITMIQKERCVPSRLHWKLFTTNSKIANMISQCSISLLSCIIHLKTISTTRFSASDFPSICEWYGLDILNLVPSGLQSPCQNLEKIWDPCHLQWNDVSHVIFQF